MRKIEFTQYILPYGNTRPQWIERPEKIAEMADALKSNKCRFSIEMLNDYKTISATIEVEKEGETEILSSFVCENGPTVIDKVDELITYAYQKYNPTPSTEKSDDETKEKI